LYSFNLFTKTIPIYFLLKTTISIFDNKSTTFSIDLPSVGFFLSLLKFEKLVKIRVFDKYQEKNIFCIKLIELFKLAIFKFPELPISKSFLIL
jgi:hypothetical protein